MHEKLDEQWLDYEAKLKVIEEIKLEQQRAKEEQERLKNEKFKLHAEEVKEVANQYKKEKIDHMEEIWSKHL